MRSVEESIQELKDQIAKLDKLIKMGETYIHMFNTATKEYTMDDIPADIQEDYIGLLETIDESRTLKKDLEGLLHIAEVIVDRKKMFADHDQEPTDKGAENDE